MKYRSLRLPHVALVLLTALPLCASAQSAVSIYGNINLALVKETHQPSKLDRGYLNWLGFTGSEDLGGGTYATFNLLTRFLADTGQNESSSFWHGESTVGLKNASLGQVRLGRSVTPMWANKYQFEPWGDGWMTGSLGKYQATARYMADPANCVSDCPGFARWNNGIFYDSPSFGGLEVHLGGQVETSPGASGRGSGVSLNYASGALKAMLAWEQNTSSAKALYLGASYDFGSAVVMGSVGQSKVPGAADETAALIAATFSLDGINSLRTGYGRNLDTKDSKVSLGAIHHLSKRTQIYADVYREKTASSVNGFALGMQHSF